jgi:hypothetical protein
VDGYIVNRIGTGKPVGEGKVGKVGPAMLGGIVGTVVCGGALNMYGCVGVTVEAEEHGLVGINGGIVDEKA